MAELTTIFFKRPDGQIVKAIVPLAHIDFFGTMGGRRFESDFEKDEGLPDEQEKQPEKDTQSDDSEDAEAIAPINPDQGSGRPGSVKFHTLSILELQSVEAIASYVHVVTGQSLDARIKKIDKAKRVAVKLIKDWASQNDRQNA